MWSTLLQRVPGGAVRLARNSSGVPPSLLRNYEKFQKDDGVPVYLKGGAKDRALFGLTAVLIAIGLTDGLYTIFQMARPKKK